jgi:N-acetylneuraminic acid mutarotase
VHEVYDPTSDTWTSAAPLPTPRDHLAVAAVAGRLVAVGGRVDGSPARNLDVTQVYNPATDTWSAAPPLPTPRSGVASAVLGTELYVFGGESGSKVFAEVEAYDLAANRWRRLARMPTARHGFGAVSFEGRIFTITGSPRPGGGGSRIVEVFKP